MESPHRNPNFTTDRPVAVLMVFLAAVVFGYFSLGQLPVTLMPEMSYPTLTVRTEYPGAAPEEVENDISRRIEEALGVVSGLNEISSISRAGVSDVILEFVWGTSMIDAIQNTLEKLDLVYMPREAEKPLLLHYDPSLDPVMELSLSGSSRSIKYKGDEGLRRLRRIAELQVKRQIEPVKGVAAARVRGGLEEEIHVLIDEAKLQRVNLSISQVLSRLRAENINAAGGRIREGGAEYMIRTINEYQNLEEIANTIVFRRDGREIRVKDLGEVVYGQRDREMLTHTDGRESVQIDIYKEADANMVEVAKFVNELVGEISGSSRSTLAGKLRAEEDAYLRVVADRSIFIDNSIKEVRNTAIFGGILAIMVLLGFLRDIRTTAIIAVSIPISILVTFAPLNILEVSLNIMSLGGLAMGIGMLVDSSIVVLESIYRCRQEGDSIRAAAIRGTTEVRGAVIASTLTSICVFFPMVFVEGLAGQVFSDLGLTVVTSLIASLIVAVLFIPMLASRTGFKLQAGVGMVSHTLGSIEGRISLSTLWLRIILPIVILLVVMIGLVLGYSWWMVSISDDPRFEEEIVYGALALTTLTVCSVAAFVCPLLASLAKRLHDLGQPAWWLLAFLPILLPVFALMIIPELYLGLAASVLLLPICCIPGAILTIILLVIPGNSTNNRFGPASYQNQSLAKLWGSFRAFYESMARNQGNFFFQSVAAVYFALRLAISFMLELIGLSFLWSIRTIGATCLFTYQIFLKLGSLFALFFRKSLGTSKDSEETVDTRTRLYSKLIRWALASPTAMAVLTASCFALTYWVGTQLETELLPEVHQSEFTFEVALPVGTPLDQTVSILDDVEKTILKDKEIKSKIEAIEKAAADLSNTDPKANEVARLNMEKLLLEFSTITQEMELKMPSQEEIIETLKSGDSESFFSGKFTDKTWERINDLGNIDTLLVMYGFDTTNMKRSDEGEHSTRFKVLLKPSDNPKQTEEEVIARLRSMFEEVPDITTRVTRPVLFSSKKPVVIQINGEELPELKQYSDEATALLSKESDLADVEPTLRSGAPEVQITYDRQQIIRHDLNLNSVANQVRDMVKGSEATRLNRRDRRVPIVVRLAEKDRAQVADVGKLTINPGAETPIPLNSIAKLTVGEGPSEIRRIDGKRVALVQANIGDRSLGSAVETANRTLRQKIDWPGYMDFFITGQNKEWERSRSSLYLALGLSLFLVYVIMASQFESMVQPLIIMFTIPMAFVGTVLGLKILGINLSVVVFLGMIMLAGIVVNNAIVLVDYANKLRSRGLALKEAIVQAGCVRLRPILMTTATTVLGLLPMALGLGDGAEIRTPMAIAVISGLLTSTFLTLLVIPTIYYLFGLAGERLFQVKEE
ncbi:MAG: efflux RND transporter permease subunit [Verrucomicrobiota bacterium]|jgi:multidrug efflux pump subunit AcrB|nr:efflux RND transporter permease subunit [Verrucomicrobiota bacterium]